MGSDSLFFIIIAICLIMSAYFSATETAFLSLNRIRMKNMADKGNKRAALVLELEEKYDNLLSTILIGNNIVNILLHALHRHKGHRPPGDGDKRERQDFDASDGRVREDLCHCPGRPPEKL